MVVWSFSLGLVSLSCSPPSCSSTQTSTPLSLSAKRALAPRPQRLLCSLFASSTCPPLTTRRHQPMRGAVLPSSTLAAYWTNRMHSTVASQKERDRDRTKVRDLPDRASFLLPFLLLLNLQVIKITQNTQTAQQLPGQAFPFLHLVAVSFLLVPSTCCIALVSVAF